MLSLVIPVYKNEESLPRLLRELETLAGAVRDTLEVVFVVDGSPDSSLRFLQAHLPAWPIRSQLIELSRNFGSFSAIVAGLRFGRGEYFAVLAADLQEPPELVLEFHKLLASGEADVVFGHRTGRADDWFSRLTSEWFWSLYRRFVLKDLPRGGIDIFGCSQNLPRAGNLPVASAPTFEAETARGPTREETEDARSRCEFWSSRRDRGCA